MIFLPEASLTYITTGEVQPWGFLFEFLAAKHAQPQHLWRRQQQNVIPTKTMKSREAERERSMIVRRSAMLSIRSSVIVSSLCSQQWRSWSGPQQNWAFRSKEVLGHSNTSNLPKILMRSQSSAALYATSWALVVKHVHDVEKIYFSLWEGIKYFWFTVLTRESQRLL